MPDPVSLEELLRMASTHFADMIRQAYELGERAGAQRGEEAARERVLRAFDVPVAERVPEKAEPRWFPARVALSGPSVTDAIRKAISTMEIGPDGVGPQEVMTYINRTTDAGLDIGQVRSVLKVLARRGELERVKRGRYRLPAQADNIAASPPTQEAESEEPEPRPAIHRPLSIESKLNGSIAPVALRSVAGVTML